MADTGVIAAGAGGSGSYRRRRTSRRRKLLTRSAPVIVIAAASFAAGAVLAGGPGRAERQMVTRYVTAWANGNPKAMYAQLDAGSRASISESAFAARLSDTAATATETRLGVVRIGSTRGHTVRIMMTVTTRLWGTLHETEQLPVTGSGSSARVHLTSSMLFPGLTAGETLTRKTELAPRATILASDGTPLAEGPDRTSPLSPELTGEVVGTLESIPAGQARSYEARGYPADAKIGGGGLELIFQHRLAGTPGGTLYAGSRVLATAKPVAGKTTKTTINPTLEQAALESEDGKYAGVTVLNFKTGAVEAWSGVALSADQPPGSTMKIITAAAALQDHLYTPASIFPTASSTTIDGYTIHNDDDEPCGGTFTYSFAESCDPVFANVGAKLGAKRLVAMARRFGFDQTPSLKGAYEPMIPSAKAIGSALDVGESAIGQGKVLSTTLEQADAAATIADHGRRPIPNLLYGAKPRSVRVTTPKVASEIQQMMIDVVQYGTGTTAQIPGVTLAGKTGTAELTTTTNANNPKDTDSWFVGYPVGAKASVVACALFPASGYGSATAAPAVRAVIETALGL